MSCSLSASIGLLEKSQIPKNITHADSLRPSPIARELVESGSGRSVYYRAITNGF
jgi:hypothetical protein